MADTPQPNAGAGVFPNLGSTAQAEAPKQGGTSKKKQADALIHAIRAARTDGMDSSNLEQMLQRVDPNAYRSLQAGDRSVGVKSSGIPVTSPVPPIVRASASGQLPWQQAVQIPANSFGNIVYLGRPGIAPTARKSGGEFHMGGQDGSQQVGQETYATADQVASLYLGFDDTDKKRMVGLMDQYFGAGKWDTTKMAPFWQVAVTQAATQYALGNKVTPWDALTSYVAKSVKDGTAPSSTNGGFSAGYRDTQVNLTNPSQARGLVNNALSQYLGRTATDKEQQAFLAALQQQEKANPNVTTGSRSYNSRGASTGTSATQSGGIDPAQFAQEWAQSQEGSAEHMAATTYMDAFVNALGAGVTPAGV